VADEDGIRILVDRLWPRGLSKDKLKIDRWSQELAPSTELRKWFHHEAGRWEEFERRYRAELDSQREALFEVAKLAKGATVTLVYSAKDEEHNQAMVLQHVLQSI
jgi:uncharacterized protein YeaO (DUF488 family)